MKSKLEFNSLTTNLKLWIMEAKVKWYNKPQLVGTLLLFWPPFGWYGLYKSSNIDLKFKVAVFGAHVFAIVLLFMVHAN